MISKVTDKKNDLWKTVRLTSFQKPKLQSVSIFFKFVHPCVLLYSAVLFIPFFYCFEGLFLCFTQFSNGFHCFNFDNFREDLGSC